MITKETISTYCVDSKGDKDLAEQIARQFERAGYHLCDNPFRYLEDGMPIVGITSKGNITNGYRLRDSKTFEGRTETTLSELTKMVDEYLGYQEALEGFVKEYKQVDEYEIVREFMDWDCSYSHCTSEKKDKVMSHFKAHRTKHSVTLDQLKECYAKAEGIEADKIVVSENK